MSKLQWSTTPPTKDGDFFYSGRTPDGEEVVTIAQIYTDLKTSQRSVVLLLPPYWRGDMSRTLPTLHHGELEKWTGEWSGPEFGLCCATNSPTRTA